MVKTGAVNFADIVYGVAWGDEAKGKISHVLASRKSADNEKSYYDYVCRWNGGQNAGHTVYHNGKKFATHLVPSGVFHGIPSIIGPGCVLNIELFYRELDELKSQGIDISLVKVFPNTHIVTESHIAEDKATLGHLGTTARGIAPAYRDKYARKGLLAKDSALDSDFIFDGELSGNILCEGAQGFWLDINWGNYPYVTSSECLPYAACSLGFAPQKIRNIWGAAKIYDTRSGTDPKFPESLLDNPILYSIAIAGSEFGTTTGRPRKVNWLNLDDLVRASNTSGVTHLVISKCDVLEQIGVYNLFYKNELLSIPTITEMKNVISEVIKKECLMVSEIIYSHSAESI